MTTSRGTNERPLDHRDATFYKVPRRRRPVLATFGWVGFVLLALVGATIMFADRYANYALSNPENDSADIRSASLLLSKAPADLSSKPLNVLVLGTDERPGEGRGRSDTLILFRLDFKRQFISQLSFPRDLYVNIPGHGYDKINAAYSAGGTPMVIDTVKQLTGETDISYVFNVNFQAFRDLVNNAGGVWMDVDRHYFNDNSGSDKFQTINIPPGYQRLSGYDALNYVRYRHYDSDFARIVRQQLFLTELRRETQGASGLNNIVDALHRNLQTNLKSSNTLRQLLQFALTLDKGRIARTQVQGTPAMRNSASVVISTDTQIQNAVEQWRNPEFQQQTGADAKAANPADLVISVYNGTGRPNLGLSVGKALEKKGYHVYMGGNASTDYPSTVVYYASGKESEARALATQFGPNAVTGMKRSGMDADMDLVVMIGNDFDGLHKPRKAKATKVKPDTVSTLSLKPIVQRFRQRTKMDALVPTKLPRGSSVIYVREYNIERGDKGAPNALTIVLALPAGRLGGTHSYATITQTNMKNLPLPKAADGTDRFGMRTWYDGKSMERLLWQKGNMSYWITNTLDTQLSAETIRDMQAFMVRPAKAKLKKGQTNTKIAIEEKGRTP